MQNPNRYNPNFLLFSICCDSAKKSNTIYNEIPEIASRIIRTKMKFLEIVVVLKNPFISSIINTKASRLIKMGIGNRTIVLPTWLKIFLNEVNNNIFGINLIVLLD
jgi:hypothetical protein